MKDDRTLSELCELIVDSEHRTAPKDPEGLHPLVRTSNLGRGRVDYASAQRVSRDTYVNWTRRARPEEGDLILAREAPVGGIGIVPAGVRPVLGQRTVLLRPNGDVDSRFLMYRLAAEDLQCRMSEMATGATVPHLNMVDIRSFVVPDVPTLTEQRRRTSVLAAVDELIAVNERRIEVLEDLTRSLYREWFVRLRFPGNDGASAEGRLPDGWTLGRLGDVVEVNRSTAKVGELPNPIRYLDISSVSPRRIDDVQLLVADEAPSRARRRVSDGDTAWAMVRPNRRSHAILHSPPENLVASTGLAILSPTAIPASYLFEHSSTQEFADYLMGRATGAAYPAVRPDDFREAPIAIPPRDVLAAFDAFAGPALRLTSALADHNRAFARMRDLLLPGLVTGRLDLSDIDLAGLSHHEGVT